MRKSFRFVNKVAALTVGAVGGALVTAQSASADAVDTAITALGVTGASYVADALGVALIVVGGFWGISVMKKAMNAAK